MNDYFSELMPEAFPWRGQMLALPSAIPPTMMSEDEISYLLWLAREIYSGAGVIIDAGCLRGASTVCFAAGLRDNRAWSGTGPQIHSYDLFEFHSSYREKLFPGTYMQPGDSFVRQFVADIGEFHDLVEVHAGDITKSHWSGKPIEILFLDVLKSNEINNHVLREYFSWLIPQRSIVIQQDYFHFYCYWIHLTMGCLTEYFQVLPSPQGGTLAFRLLKPIPRELLEKDYVNGLTIAEKKSLMDAAVAAHTGMCRLQVMSAKARMLEDAGDCEGAYALLETIYNSPDWRTDYLLGELATIIKLIRMKPNKIARSPIIQTIEKWDDRLNAKSELRLLELVKLISSRPVIIWGAGPTGCNAFDQAQIDNILVTAFIDRDPALIGTSRKKLLVQHPDALTKFSENNKPYVIIGSHSIREIAQQLENWGYHYESDYNF